MAFWAIFHKQSSNSNTLFKVATTDSIKDNYYQTFYDAIEITETQAQELLTGTKLCTINRSDSSVVFTDSDEGEMSKEATDFFIAELIKSLDAFLRNNNVDSSVNSSFSDWKTALEGLDTSSLTWPIQNTTVEKVLKNQLSQTKYSPLLIP
jgi:hypothetical protein